MIEAGPIERDVGAILGFDPTLLPLPDTAAKSRRPVARAGAAAAALLVLATSGLALMLARPAAGPPAGDVRASIPPSPRPAPPPRVADRATRVPVSPAKPAETAYYASVAEADRPRTAPERTRRADPPRRASVSVATASSVRRPIAEALPKADRVAPAPPASLPAAEPAASDTTALASADTGVRTPIVVSATAAPAAPDIAAAEQEERKAAERKRSLDAMRLLRRQ
ncbi:hypothetical protein [Sphingomonas profundi]|uniref:hypothetical protein n=1 Tax=Alterirhizorhabdus profundi TaxID=2681549 RepID=UPI0012E85F9D|nr:hypothetical protein [Sphingomonas profundi]